MFASSGCFPDKPTRYRLHNSMFYSMFYSYNYSVIGNLLCNNFRWECTKLVFNHYYYFSHALCTHSWTSCMSRRAGKFHLHCDMQGTSLSWISAAFTWYDSIPTCSYNTWQLLLWPFSEQHHCMVGAVVHSILHLPLALMQGFFWSVMIICVGGCFYCDKSWHHNHHMLN